MNTGQGQWNPTTILDTQASSTSTEPTFGLSDAGFNTAVLLGMPELNVNGSKKTAVEYGADIVDLMLDSCFQSASDTQVRREEELIEDFSSSRTLDHYSAYADMFQESLTPVAGDSSVSFRDDSRRDDDGGLSMSAFQVSNANGDFSLSTGAMNRTNSFGDPIIPPVNGNQLRIQPVLCRSRERGGKRKSKRAPAKPWSKEEHEKFERALEMFGRNWGECARYIGTRPAPLVRSHAQKYLIKLWKTGKPLPKKVAESGKGYTLSGKPLHPESASARSYLTKIPCPQNAEKK